MTAKSRKALAELAKRSPLVLVILEEIVKQEKLRRTE
jgi:hypothetical protein